MVFPSCFIFFRSLDITAQADTCQEVLNWISHPVKPAHSPPNETASVNKEYNNSTLHVYFSKLRPSMIGKVATSNGFDQRETPQFKMLPNPNRHRSHSLHWDRRQTSLMCLKDSSHCCSQISHPSKLPIGQVSSEFPPKKRCNDEKQELPMLVSVERNTINHVLSMLTSTLPVQDSLEEVVATLHRLSASMHVQSIFETAAKPCEECSDDIIIRNQPIKHHSSDDITSNRPMVSHHKSEFSDYKHGPNDFSHQHPDNMRFIRAVVPPVNRLKGPNYNQP